ncbi:hypothetical protein GGU10DRAFT_377149 [Lentinula aff. detonsa]|uniref:Uncharacterized protein n=1 Tax=Lentinula aff. detonsa TaxID=2804958 RepID=A0AA38KFF4_9AGAR|nr:hypothetical protein GGU10DRAFT_377149 [Lentinula aff. detonsa]
MSFPVNPYDTIPDPENPLQETPAVAPQPAPGDPVTFGMVQTGFASFQTVLDNITERLNQLTSVVTNPPAPAPIPHQPTPPPTIPAPSGSAPKSPKFKEPSTFDGKGSKVEGFMQEISDALTLLRHNYTSGTALDLIPSPPRNLPTV